MAVGARLHFDSRQLVLTQTGGKPQTVPLRISTRTIKRTPNSAQTGMIRCIDPDEYSSSDIGRGIGEQEYEEELPSEDECKHLLELFEHEIPEEFRVYPDTARSFHVDLGDSALAPPKTQVSPSVLLGETILQVSDLADDLEAPRTLYEEALSLRTRYQQTEQYLDVSVFPPRSLLTTGATIALIKQEAEAPVDDVPDLMQEMTDLIGLTVEQTSAGSETDAETKETETITGSPAESQMFATVFSVRTSSSVFSSVYDQRERPVDWIDIPLQIYEESTIALPNHVPTEFRKSLICVLNGYAEVLSILDNDIGLTNVIEHAILTGDHPPISCVPYRYSPAQRAAAFQRIKEFKVNGWIEPAIGPWSFPVVIVPKKVGGIRICIDYRKVNDITIKDVYPLPRIDELLNAIGSARFFSKFDVRHGFHHLLVRKEDRPKIAFVLFEGTWQWIRCPMGICNAPATFQRAMNMAFHNFVRKTRLAQGIINYCVIVYMDDILVYSSSYEGHVQHIEWALHALRDTGFKVALKKCQFFLTTISFLGHVVTDKGLQLEPQKVAVVRDAPVPTTITQVRTFLGVASYYQRFIKGFATIAGPLTNLLRKDQSFIWTSECDQAFSKLKVALISAPVRIRPDPEKPFVLIIDWQPEAISAILAQVGPGGLENVVEYASKSVPACKCNYAAPTGECYAALWGISHFRAYLYGRKFTLVTDHEPLLALKKSKDYSGMIGRWATVLQSMDFDIRHRKHERHGNADGLTRLHRPEKVPKSEEVIPWNEPKQEVRPRYCQVEVLSKQ
ncbi:hypothetical protein CBR_g29415 [Chara braunii]|uniref:Reverse transcriptase domain-containing protein n=1 Tax=Chara braunii TaxID=69332 RepID=A0A388LAQ4_CHABU|nr:hypothetical protein CBR_g29415 [Chara braunii]|eukprot:GBG79263.1 hypothetical protein CBR_g29415 [Chara braunii]